MSGISNKRVWTRQPTGSVRINWSNPLTRGLIFAGDASTARNLVSGALVTNNNGALQVASPLGLGRRFASASSQYLSSSFPARTLTDFTLFAFVNVDSFAAQQTIVYVGQAGSSTARAVLYSAQFANRLSLNVVTGGNNPNVQAGTSVAGRWYALCGTSNTVGSVHKLYFDGALQVIDTTGSVNAITNADTVGIGARNNVTWGIYSNSTVLCPLVWGRVLSDAEVAEISRNPWQLFAPANAPVFYSLPATGGAFTLTASTGAFTLTGNAATLVAQRQLAVATAAFTLTGNAATLAAQRQLAAATGAFTLTGNAATLTYTPAGAYVMAAATGTFSLTGNATGLTAQRKLPVSVGAFTLTGNAAAFTHSYTLTAAKGTFTLSGQGATLSTTGTVVSTTKGGKSKAKVKSKAKPIPDPVITELIQNLESEKKVDGVITHTVQKIVPVEPENVKIPAEPAKLDVGLKEVKKLLNDLKNEPLDPEFTKKQQKQPETPPKVDFSAVLDRISAMEDSISTKLVQMDGEIKKLRKMNETLEEMLILLTN